MKLPEPLDKLSKIKYAKIIGILLTFIIDILLLMFAMSLGAETGYYFMMVGLVAVTFAVPYLFGHRDGKFLVIIGVGMFLLIGAINGPLVVHDAYSSAQDEPAVSNIHLNWFTKEYNELENHTYTTSAAWYNLSDGSVDGYRGAPGDTYRFKVTMYSNSTSTPTILMGYARGIWGIEGTPEMTETDPSDLNYLDGKDYYYDITISDPGIYSYWFAIVFYESQTNSVNTTVGLGPLVGTEIDNWGTYIPIGAASMFCNIGLLFLIIVLLYWWLETAKEKRKTWDIALRDKEDDVQKDDAPIKDDSLEEKKPFTCDQCGAGVGDNDNFCPKCGERFDGVEDAAIEDISSETKAPEEKKPNGPEDSG